MWQVKYDACILEAYDRPAVSAGEAKIAGSRCYLSAFYISTEVAIMSQEDITIKGVILAGDRRTRLFSLADNKLMSDRTVSLPLSAKLRDQDTEDVISGVNGLYNIIGRDYPTVCVTIQ